MRLAPGRVLTSGTGRAATRGGVEVIELEHGITVYPAREEQGRWRAVWQEDGKREQCEAVIRYALRLLRRRGMDIRLGTTVTAMRPGEEELSDGTVLPCRTVLWTACVTPPPIVVHLGLPVRRRRLVVHEYLKPRDHAGPPATPLPRSTRTTTTRWTTRPPLSTPNARPPCSPGTSPPRLTLNDG